MLRELAKLSGGMLFLGGHVTDLETARRLARDDAPADQETPRGGHRAHRTLASGRDWRTPFELLALAAVWGGSFLFLRIAAPKFGPLPLVDVRLALGALVLSPFLWRARRQLAAAGWFKIMALGLVNTSLPFLLFAWSSERAPAGVNAIVMSMAVPFAALAAFAMFGERIGGRRLVGLALGLVGVVVLASDDVGGAGLGPAVAAGAGGAFLYGASSNLVKRHFSGLPPAAVAAATLAWGAVLLAPFAAWQWPSAHVPAQAWFSLIALGVVCTGFAYAIYYRLIQRVGAPRATTVTYLVPIFGVLWAWLALGEPLTLSMAVGGALILGGMLYGQLQPRRPAVRRLAVMRTSARPGVECHG
ncbi:MAG: Permease of the drug/metabolite transporter (DMT) superfamily [Rhodanobacteraceae bacterium]|jgi:drug/metabolite transporter (DMT)-like permease|nr:MAG: Permease of the drug/metabolite transporter (DMT) superfamily [Rhodanobacteraceae bacterium]